jgi:hypothetical protein
MTQYVLTYRQPATNEPPAEDPIEAWNTFFNGLGDHLVDPGNPVFSSRSLGNLGSSGVYPLGGYSIIEADDLDAAVALAQDCPALRGGGVEVGEITVLDEVRDASKR